MNKNKNIFHNQKHMTLSDRTYIEQELCQGSSFKSIANTLGKDPTTISKEIRKHRKELPGKYYSENCRICKWWDDCTVKAGDPEVSITLKFVHFITVINSVITISCGLIVMKTYRNGVALKREIDGSQAR